MYTPKNFAMDDPAEIAAHILAHPFATLVATGADGPTAVHLPLLHDAEAGILRGHIARANGFFGEVVSGAPVLAIFSGPQGYVSPSFYPSKKDNPKVVPTWNYTAVHVSGTLTFHDEPEWLLGIVRDLTRRFEAGRDEPWSVDDAPAEYIDALVRGIVGVEIAISGVEGKAKLSQNRSEDDRRGVADGLMRDGNSALAGLIK